MSDNLQDNTDHLNIIDVNEETFTLKVIEESVNRLVLADFWAPWCNPCKQLSPTLVNIAEENQNKILLAKINIDENKQLAGQLRIQSIPTVFAFKNKKIVDGFQGVIPKNKIIEFIEKNLGESLAEDFSSFFDQINELLQNQKNQEAKNLLEEFLVNHSDNSLAISLYINCLNELSMYQEAQKFIDALSDNIINDPRVSSSIANLDLNKKQNKNHSIEQLEKMFKKDPKNIDVIIDLSKKYFTEKNFNNAFNLLLEEYLKFKDKEQQKIKTTLLKYFDALGNDNENTKIFRKKFSSIIFS